MNIRRFSCAAALLKAGSRNKTLPFSHLTYENLAGLNIIPDERGKYLKLKPNFAKRAALTHTLGTGFWSAEHFHSHLEVLRHLVPHVNEANARTWTDAFFFRASAMVPSSRNMVLSMEPVVKWPDGSSTNQDLLSGHLDYLAVLSNNLDLRSRPFLSNPTFPNLDNVVRSRALAGLFITEAKSSKSRPEDLIKHIPQAIGEIYACANNIRQMRQYNGNGTLRGALTNGRAWVFIVVMLNPDGNGAKYRCSVPIAFRSDDPPKILKPWPDVLASIIFHWIENSLEDLGSDDWFESSKVQGVLAE